jgi:hypothetical protein
MFIRNETVSDIEAIAEVTIAAFRTLPREGVLEILTFSPGLRMNLTGGKGASRCERRRSIYQERASFSEPSFRA